MWSKPSNCRNHVKLHLHFSIDFSYVIRNGGCIRQSKCTGFQHQNRYPIIFRLSLGEPTKNTKNHEQVFSSSCQSSQFLELWPPTVTLFKTIRGRRRRILEVSSKSAKYMSKRKKTLIHFKAPNEYVWKLSSKKYTLLLKK